MHFCHANGCLEEAHPEIPFCKLHFKLLPEAHQKKLWAGRPKGRCGACLDDSEAPGRANDWHSLYNLGVAIIANLEAPEYDPRPEWMDEQGFCWMGGINDAVKTMKTSRAVVEKFSLRAALSY